MNVKDYLNNKKNFEFFIININNKNSFYDEIVNIFTGIFLNPFIISDRDHTIILTNETNCDINQAINAMIEDFGIKMKVFKSNRIDAVNYEYLDILKKLYYKYENQINENYISIKQLCLHILEKNIDDITLLKPIIVGKILNDPKLSEIINGMFLNDLNVCKTANYVYMHRNTINNKLNLIKEETGLDVQKFQEAVILFALIKK